MKRADGVRAVLRCDFCGEMPAVTRYECPNFTLPARPNRPARITCGCWWACGACMTLVDTGDQRQLSRRVLAVHLTRTPRRVPWREQQEFLETVQEAHRTFFALRITGVERLPEEHGSARTLCL